MHLGAMHMYGDLATGLHASLAFSDSSSCSQWIGMDVPSTVSPAETPTSSGRGICLVAPACGYRTHTLSIKSRNPQLRHKSVACFEGVALAIKMDVCRTVMLPNTGHSRPQCGGDMSVDFGTGESNVWEVACACQGTEERTKSSGDKEAARTAFASQKEVGSVTSVYWHTL